MGNHLSNHDVQDALVLRQLAARLRTLYHTSPAHTSPAARAAPHIELQED
jgi:hypothetical protein